MQVPACGYCNVLLENLNLWVEASAFVNSRHMAVVARSSAAAAPWWSRRLGCAVRAGRRGTVGFVWRCHVERGHVGSIWNLVRLCLFGRAERAVPQISLSPQ